MDGLHNASQLPGPAMLHPSQPQQDNSHSRQSHLLEAHQIAPSKVSNPNGVMRSANQDAYQHVLQEKSQRGRERTRDSTAPAEGQDGIEQGESPENDEIGPTSGSRPRKRRRSRKGLDKKYECPQPGCGKSYSRAEHLYRHQLNHQPKQIYHCDYPDCKRSFVRQDLCTRHRERHTNRGSQLQRKDNFMNNAGPSGIASRDRRNSVINKSAASQSPTLPKQVEKETNLAAIPDNVHLANRNAVSTSPEKHGRIVDGRISTTEPVDPETDRAAKVRRTASNSVSGSQPSLDETILRTEAIPRSNSIAGNNLQQGQLSFSPPVSKPSFSRSIVETAVTPTMNLHGLTLQSPYSATSPHPYSAQAVSASLATPVTASSAGQFNHQSNYGPFSLPQPAYPNMTQTTAAGPSNDGFMTISPTSTAMNHTAVPATSAGVMDLAEEYQMTHTIPIFGENYSRSPHWQSADPGYFDWLLSNAEETQLTTSQAGLANSFVESSNPGGMSNFYGFSSEYPNSLYATLAPHPMAVNSIIAPPSPNQETLLSDGKRAQLFDLMNTWPDAATIAADSRGLRIDDDRVPPELSLTMMQTYISLYWVHFHPQLPILHRPTFAADKTPDALLLAIITIGAACMDYKADPTLAQAAADVALIISKDLRFSIFNDDDFRPPAKLWVFQALLLLETYEKMYANRMLHERAHIHHATTLTLMRRGSSLTGGRSGAHDSPQSGRDMKSMSDTSSMTFSGQTAQGTGNTTDEAWSRWIVQEATKRVAFAAFILDSTHATMFGHSAVMVTHEMRLPLPCDEGLWSASTASELFRAQSSLTQAGVRPPMFLDALKKTLNGQPVRTNSFGRTILMAGLLSVSWNMNQRDIQISSLGVSQQLGGREKWRHSLTVSFDHWKAGFDQWLHSLRSTATNDLGYYISTEDVEHENIFESRTTLHHLAHMSMHVDIVDLQIYAGSRQILGRTISHGDMANTRKRMKDWAGSIRARDAYLYAIQFLCQVMIPEERVDMHYNADEDDPDTPGSRVSGGTTGVPVYSARDDHLLNRPWILYYACLVVYAYALALEGPLRPPFRVPQTQAERFDDMRAYLKRVGGADSDKLGTLPHKNCCLGLLMTLQELFGQCRWELLVEASRNLQRCADILTGEVEN